MKALIRRGAIRVGETVAMRGRQMRAQTISSVSEWHARMAADAQQNNQGTRWGRGVAVVAPTIGVAAVLGMSISEGAVAASFNVANVPLTAYIDQVDAEGLAAVIGSIDVKNPDGSTTTQAVLHAALSSGSLQGVCAIARQDVMGVTYSLVIRAASDGVASGTNLVLDATEANGTDVTVHNLTVGRSADEISLNGENLGGTPGGFGVDGSEGTAHLENVVGTAYGAELIGALKASDFTAKIEKGDGKC